MSFWDTLLHAAHADEPIFPALTDDGEPAVTDETLQAIIDRQEVYLANLRDEVTMLRQRVTMLLEQLDAFSSPL